MDDVAVVLGGAAPEEVAAVLAVLSARLSERGAAESEPVGGYAAWRRTRLLALGRYGSTTWNSTR